jgi:hypothetical protein
MVVTVATAVTVILDGLSCRVTDPFPNDREVYDLVGARTLFERRVRCARFPTRIESTRVQALAGTEFAFREARRLPGHGAVTARLTENAR